MAAQTVVANPVGLFKAGAYDGNGNYMGLLANSDTLVGLPLTRASEFVGRVQSVTSNVVTISGTPNWTNNQFIYVQGTQPKTYYALIGAAGNTPNPKEGCFYTVIANSADSLTLDLNGDTISSIPQNAQISLIPYWTLATIFPPTKATVFFTPTVSTRAIMTKVLIPNYTGVGVNLSSSATYFFINSGTNVGWRLFGDNITKDHGDDILMPNGYFIVRNSNGAPTLPLIITGSVLTEKLVTPLTSIATGYQDNLVSMVRPTDVSLNDCGLSVTDGSFVATTSTRAIKDRVLIFDNAQVMMNKSSVRSYYYMNNGWRLYGDAPTSDHGGDVIPAGSAFIIRKASTSGEQTFFWANSPNY